VDRLLRFLFDNPIVLFVLVAWVAGAIGNAMRAARKRQESGSTRTPPPLPSRETEPAARRSAEDVAREMRRILGMEETPAEVTPEARPVARQPVEARSTEPTSTESSRPRSLPTVGRREPAVAERPPTPAMPTTQNRRLHLHEASHLGERMQHRHSPQSRRVAPPADRELGSLGGRVHAASVIRREGVRLVDLSDLKRVFVMNEILGKPLALRSSDQPGG